MAGGDARHGKTKRQLFAKTAAGLTLIGREVIRSRHSHAIDVAEIMDQNESN